METYTYKLLKYAVDANASDLHITLGAPPMIRKNGLLKKVGEEKLLKDDIVKIVKEILNETLQNSLDKQGEIDMSFQIPSLSRFRVNIFKQQGCYSLAIRIINMNPPAMDDLGFPASIKELALKRRGLILITGPTGSGKSTTLAAMIDYINSNRNCHILTLEDPIEYVHNHKKSVINQREIGTDTRSFVSALRSALREDPDVILLGEMRDLETISTAITAAETGHLVLSTLHTIGADQTVDRIIDVFPTNQQVQIKAQLASVLEGVISQQLVPFVDGKGRTVALEIMISNNAIKNIIREGKTHQLKTIIQTSLKSGMYTMDYSLAKLVKDKHITKKTALEYAIDPEMVKCYLNS